MKKFFLIVLVFSLLIKLFWFFFLRVDAWDDTHEYEVLAYDLLQGRYRYFTPPLPQQLVGIGNYTRPPMYPFLIAITYAFTHDRLVSLHFPPLFLSSFVPPLIFAYSWRLTSKLEIALFTGFLSMMMPPSMFFGSQPLSDPIYLFFVTLTLYIIDTEAKTRKWLWSGLSSVFAFLTRPEGAILLPLLLIILVVKEKSRARLHALLLLLSSFLLPLAIYISFLHLTGLGLNVVFGLGGAITGGRFLKNFALLGVIVLGKYLVCNPILHVSLALGFYTSLIRKLSAAGLFLAFSAMQVSSLSYSIYSRLFLEGLLFVGFAGERYFLASTLPLAFYTAIGFQALKDKIAAWNVKAYKVLNTLTLSSIATLTAFFNTFYIWRFLGERAIIPTLIIIGVLTFFWLVGLRSYIRTSQPKQYS